MFDSVSRRPLSLLAFAVVCAVVAFAIPSAVLADGEGCYGNDHECTYYMEGGSLSGVCGPLNNSCGCFKGPSSTEGQEQLACKEEIIQ